MKTFLFVAVSQSAVLCCCYIITLKQKITHKRTMPTFLTYLKVKAYIESETSINKFIVSDRIVMQTMAITNILEKCSQCTECFLLCVDNGLPCKQVVSTDV